MSKKELFRRMLKSKFFIVGSIMVLFILLLAFVGPSINPYDPGKAAFKEKLIAPEWFSKGINGHILGTDSLGRDMLSRLISGARTSLFIAFCCVSIPMVIGTIIGVTAGYFGKWVDIVIMRISDIFQAIPQMILAVTIMSLLGASVRNLIMVMCITGWFQFCRMGRGNVISLRNQEFVSAARVIGASNPRIMFREILPNILTPLIVQASNLIGSIILQEASLSYLGMGVPLDTPSWGSMISEGRQYIATYPWTVLVPGAALMFTVLAFNFLGDGIRDILDPKSKD